MPVPMLLLLLLLMAGIGTAATVVVSPLLSVTSCGSPASLHTRLTLRCSLRRSDFMMLSRWLSVGNRLPLVLAGRSISTRMSCLIGSLRNRYSHIVQLQVPKKLHLVSQLLVSRILLAHVLEVILEQLFLVLAFGFDLLFNRFKIVVEQSRSCFADASHLRILLLASKQCAADLVETCLELA